MQKKRIKIAPSILSADFCRLGEQIAEVSEAGADYIHIDVMDGHFVPNITIGPAVVASLRSKINIPLDVHLMIEQPEKHISQFIAAGSNIITVHVEASQHLHRLIDTIKSSGIKAGVSLNPATPITSIDEVLSILDLVLIMSVDPGFGGQTFIEGMINKITRMRKKLDDSGAKAELEVDGGINNNIALKVVQAGADVLVAGSAVFNAQQNPSEALRKMRTALDLPS